VALILPKFDDLKGDGPWGILAGELMEITQGHLAPEMIRTVVFSKLREETFVEILIGPHERQYMGFLVIELVNSRVSHPQE